MLKEECERSNREVRLKNDNLELYCKQLEKEREALSEKNLQLSSQKSSLEVAKTKLSQQVMQLETEIETAHKKLEHAKEGKRSQKCLVKEMDANI